MATNLQGYDPSLQKDQVSLCHCIKEILGVICYFHNNEGKDAAITDTVQNLELSIHVKKKSQEGTDILDVFTVKVKCNQVVPIMSLLKELETSKLIAFVQRMQKNEGESHLAVRLPDSNDLSFTRTFVLWISPLKGDNRALQIQKETVSKRTAPESDNLVMQLRVFMKASGLINEIRFMSQLLCCFKILNPLVDISLFLEGIHGEELNLRNNGYFPCESLLMSTDSKLYNHIAPSDGYMHECDASLLKTFYASTEETIRFPIKVVCGLIFHPLFKDTSGSTQRISFESRGEIFIQVYDSNRVPLDMLEFCLHFQITPDFLLPSDEFRSVMKIIGTSSIASYNMGCYVEIIQDANLPHRIKECDRFNIWMCFVLDQELAYNHPNSSSVLVSMKELANDTFQQLFIVEKQSLRHHALSCSQKSQNDHEASVKNWITDITASLSNIYIKSTDLTFRANVAKIVPVHTCVSMKSYLQEKLETILLNCRGPHGAQSSSGNNTRECNTADDEWKDFPLSQLSSHEDENERSMTPDSLDMMEHEWNETINNKDMDGENVHDVGSFGLSQQAESSALQFSRDTCGMFGSSALENISHDEISPICESVIQPGREDHFHPNNFTIQSQLKSASFQGCIHHETSSKEGAFGLEAELNAWKSYGGLNHERVDYGSLNINEETLIENRNHSSEDDSYRQDHYNGSQYVDEPLMKRSNSDNEESNFKKMRMDNELSTDVIYSRLNGMRECFDGSSPSYLSEKPRSCNDDRVEQAIPDFTHIDQIGDDWFDKDEFDQWCAELQN